MYQLGHIITATQLLKNFSRITRYLKGVSEPVLITQKNGQFLVFISAEMFEDLAREKLKSAGINPPVACLREMINPEN